MRQRRETVEHPFGTMKARMGATHFLMKTLPKVATEMALSRARLQSDARHEHRRRQAADRGDGRLRRPSVGGCASSQPLRMCVGRTTVASRPKSEKYARNDRIAAQPTGQGPPTPHPKRPKWDIRVGAELLGYAVLLGIAPKRHSSRCKTRRVGATRFLTPTLIKLSGYSGARSPRPSSTCFRRLGTTIALLLASLPSALRLFRDWLCRDVALETSQRSSSQ